MTNSLSSRRSYEADARDGVPQDGAPFATEHNVARVANASAQPEIDAAASDEDMGSSHTHSAGEDAAGDEEGGEADEAGGEEEGEDGEGGEGEAGEGEGDEEAGEGDEEDDEEDDEEEEGEGEERGGEDDNKQRTSNVDIDARRARIIRQLNDMGMDPESPQTRRAMECYLSRLQSGRAGAYSSSSQSPSTGSSTVLSDDQALLECDISTLHGEHYGVPK